MLWNWFEILLVFQQNPPNFLIGKYMEDIHLSRQVVLAGEEPNFEDTSFIFKTTTAAEASPSHSFSSLPEPTPAPTQRTNGTVRATTLAQAVNMAMVYVYVGVCW